LVLLLQACGGVDSGTPQGEFVPPVVDWELVFEDNFDGTTLDASKWNIDEGDGCPDLCGWGNNELQVYSADNISVANGVLRIEGRQEADSSYTSGRLNTKGKFDFQYGRVEVSARIPSGQGTWPAIWLLHSDPTIYGPWPLSGEIDIMEAFNYGVGGNQSTKSTTHYGLPIPPFDGTGSTTDLSANADTSFHEYALEWERGRIRFFVDGQHFQTQIVDEYWTYYPADDDGLYDPFGPYTLGLEDAPFDQAFHLLLNFAIGGNPVGDPDASTVFPQAMEVDYVRVYECANSNPESRRGCGTADASVEVLSDHDGGPLEGANTAKPYIEMLELFLDGPETVTLTVGEETGTNTLQVDGFTGDGATVVSDPAAVDPDDPENVVWQVAISGGVANVFLASEDLTDDTLLDTGFDVSGSGLGGDPVGEIVFDMLVNTVSDDATIVVKLDSGFPNAGEVVLPLSEVAVGEWKTYSIKFEDLVANPGFVECCGGQGVDLENVVNPFVFEVTTGSVDVYLDNIRITNACYVVGACGAAPRTKGIPDLVVFDDAVNTTTWDRGIVGSDSGSGFTDYTDPSNPANKVNWAVIDDADAARGQVIDVTFNDSGEFGVWFIGSSGAVDVNAFAAGAVQFDIIVDDYGNNTNGMTMKVDCFFPCTSGDKNLGVIADGVWETVTVPVSTMTATGLDLSNVNTGVVVFPTSQSGTIRFRLDNIRWIADTDALPLDQIDLPVTFDEPLVDYSVIDFEGASTSLVDDPTDAENTVASTVKGEGAQTFAGTLIGTDAGFANPIPFADGETLMSVDVYSPAAGVPVMLKVENDDASIFAEVIVNTTTADAWETLTFDFSTVGIDTSATFIRSIIFFDFGQTGVGDTYLWDNVRFGAGPTLAQIDLPVTFDESGVAYTFIDFNGTSTTVGNDPDNMNNRVGITVKGAGAETFAGTVVGDGNGFANPIPFTPTDTTMKLRVRAPAAGIPVMLKVEAAGGTPFAEVIVNTTAADTWETLEFDFSTVGIDTSATYVQAVVFFDFGQVGNDATYYWDDLSLGDLLAQIDLPVTFDEPLVDYSLSDFEGAQTVLADDPTGAVNTVAATTKTVGAQFFAGTIVGKDFGGFANPIPFTATETTMSVRVFSPAAGITIRLKVENAADPNLFAEMDVVTTVANAWEPLNFDFSTVGIDTSVEYSKAIIFFDFVVDKPGDGATYYWDDLQFGAAP
jgi:beta-glucanase (GH16 family)